MKKFPPAMLAVLTFLPALAMAFPPRPAVADSTGIKSGVIATMKIPEDVSETTIQNIVNNAVSGAANTSNAIPPGYREVVRRMGSRQIDPSELAYYGSLGYASSLYGASNNNVAIDPTVGEACGGNPSPRVVGLQQGTASESYNAEKTTYFVCEHQGTRSTLEKVITADVATLSSSYLAKFILAGTAGVNTGTATPICHAYGYANFVPGSIQFDQFGSGCRGDQLITQYSNSGFVSGTICYNQRMNSLQCYK